MKVFRIYILFFVFLLLVKGIFAEVIEEKFLKKSDFKSDLNRVLAFINRHPERLDVVKYAIILSFSLEDFEKSISLSNFYLDKKKDKEIAKVRIISYINKGNYKKAASLIDDYIKTYKPSKQEKVLFLYKKKQLLSALKFKSKGKPYIGKLLFKNKVILSLIQPDNILVLYDIKKKKEEVYSLVAGKLEKLKRKEYPGYLKGIPFNKVLFISLSPKLNEALYAIYRTDGKIGIYIKEKDDRGRWEDGVDYVSVLNIGKHNTYPNFSANGNCVIFTSDKDKKKSGFDVYFSCKKNGRFQKPKKLPGANTILDEKAVFWYNDDKTLYLVSNGFMGYGGFDIYKLTLLRKKNGYVVLDKKLMKRINTYKSEDFPFMVASDGELGLWVYKEGYNFYVYATKKELPPPIVYFYGYVIDEESKKAIRKANVSFTRVDEKESVSLQSEKDGSFMYAFYKPSQYMMKIEAKGYLYFTKQVNFEKRERFLKQIFMLRKLEIKKGFRFVMKNLFFDVGSDRIKPESYQELDALYRFLKDNPKIKIEISGHTDNRGRLEYNMKLSQKRALAVKRYLVKKGISPDRLVARGYGPTKPIASNDTEEGRRRNRRVEVKVLSNEK